MTELTPPKLTPTILRKLSRFFYNINIGRGAVTRVPRTVPTDRLVDYFGYMRCPKRSVY